MEVLFTYRKGSAKRCLCKQLKSSKENASDFVKIWFCKQFIWGPVKVANVTWSVVCICVVFTSVRIIFVRGPCKNVVIFLLLVVLFQFKFACKSRNGQKRSLCIKVRKNLLPKLFSLFSHSENKTCHLFFVELIAASKSIMNGYRYYGLMSL